VFAFSMQAERSIVADPKSPGGINSPHGLILFDGVCVLCSRGCRFVSKRDRRSYFRFVPILSLLKNVFGLGIGWRMIAAENYSSADQHIGSLRLVQNEWNFRGPWH